MNQFKMEVKIHVCNTKMATEMATETCVKTKGV